MTWDYRCPFARIGHEHVLDGLEAGAPWDVTFVPFFLNQSHVPEGARRPGTTRPSSPDLLALAAGVVVRDRYPDQFLCRAPVPVRRPPRGGRDLRSRRWSAGALTRAGVDAEAVLAEVDAGWPAKVVRHEHERCGRPAGRLRGAHLHLGDSAVFVRLMTRPDGDGRLARATVDRVLGLITDHPELNEFKHTRLALS